ncbi:hypothetical protein JAAARDRAFT_182472 [Jaapia argillacea MUCL 33604]|uniref:PQ loop repeat protein n=1 Tax=Jaapia argillacea MUCL 33604 TaxID=933084 RepID=A0A067PH35_9AGAM|nr:hypothetical protein JAAARDRAFT_182472 [Jaapia argillacea MUCL 33604]
MSETCQPHHDWFTALLTSGLCAGLVISYMPQHLRIINKKSSEGFSPWFLLLGSTSSASALLNMITMQWGVIRCCPVLSLGSCIEMTAGLFQVFLQWFLFTVILVLYMMYFPPHLKYAQIDVDTNDDLGQRLIKTPIKSDDWRLSITLSWVVFIHLAFITFVTFLLLLTNYPLPSGEETTEQILHWATFLGVTSAILAAIQYMPQLVHTYRVKVVGALSIPMMCIQSPGAVLMVLSIALRPGTNWTTWITFAVAGIMQGSLLIMCIIWTFRQRRLGIDEFGHPLPSSGDANVREPEEGLAVHGEMDVAVGYDVREDGIDEIVAEQMPLLLKNADSYKKGGRKGWVPWRSWR